MTDKQIKDGIDISQCECYSVEDNSCNDTLSGSCIKEKCQTFRLLQTIKAKEQECENYKKQFKADTKEMEDYQNEIVRHLESIEYWQHQAEAKEQECEELKEALNEGCLHNLTLMTEQRVLLQTLTEIKEIAEPYQKDIDKICGNCRRYDGCHACCMDDINCYQYKKGTTPACDKFMELKDFDINKLANQILQKISEVEDGFHS